MRKTILVTGGAGFIGSHFIKHLLTKRDDYDVINVDALSYAADLDRVKDVSSDKRYRFVKADIRDAAEIKKVFEEKIDAVVHFAAETHVDNSIDTPSLFADVNIMGTINLLNISRQYKIKRFIHISTDEVYGEIKEGRFSEKSPLLPNSPYSSSKAAADCFIRSYIRTYGFPAVVVRPCNNYGPWQYAEKFIPVAVCAVLRDDKIPVYARGLNRREWLYVADCAEAIALVLEKGKIGQIYNLGSGIEKKNIDLAKNILDVLGKPYDFISFVKDRPGHDFRYALDSSKIHRLGWEPRTDFETGINNTIDWYRTNHMEGTDVER